MFGSCGLIAIVQLVARTTRQRCQTEAEDVVSAAIRHAAPRMPVPSRRDSPAASGTIDFRPTRRNDHVGLVVRVQHGGAIGECRDRIRLVPEPFLGKRLQLLIMPEFVQVIGLFQPGGIAFRVSPCIILRRRRVGAPARCRRSNRFTVDAGKDGRLAAQIAHFVRALLPPSLPYRLRTVPGSFVFT